MTLIELLIVAAIGGTLAGGLYHWCVSILRDQTRNVEAQFAEAQETIRYLEALAAKGLQRNRDEDESTKSFVREYIVRLESAETIAMWHFLSVASPGQDVAGVVEGEHHA